MTQRLRGRCQLDVRSGDAADAARDDLDLHLVGGEFGQRIPQRLVAALHVCLDQHCDDTGLGLTHRREHVANRRSLLRKLDVAELALAIQRDFTRLALALRAEQFVTGIRRPGQTEHDHRHRGLRLGDWLAGFVEHGADPTKLLAGDDWITELQRALLDEHRGHGAATLLDRRLDDQARREASLRRAQFEHLGLQQDGVEQLVDAGACLGGHGNEDRLAAPFFRNDFVFRKLGADAFRVRVALVHLVDGHDDGYVRRARMLHGFHRLRHHAVVGCHYEHHNVRCLRAARTHRRERRVTRGIEEGHDTARRLDVIRTDVLGDAARFARSDLGLADVIEQRGLAVVDVAHDGHDRGTRMQFGGARFGSLQILLELVLLQNLGRVTHLLGHEYRSVLVDRLIDRGHHAHAEHHLDDFGGLDRHFLRQFLRRDRLADHHFALDRRLRQFERMTRLEPDRHLAIAHALLLLEARADVAGDMQFLAAVLRASLVGIGGDRLGSTGPRLLDDARRDDFRRLLAPSLGIVASLLLGGPARVLSRTARLNFLFDPPTVLGLDALGIAALRLKLFAFGAGLVLDLALLGVDLVLLGLGLLLDFLALHVSALDAHLDVHRTSTPGAARELQLALRLALQSDLARCAGRGGVFLGLAVAATQMRQQLELGFVTDPVFGSCYLDPGLVELQQQLVDRDLEDFGKLRNGYVGHQLRPSANQGSRAFMMSLPASSGVRP